MLTETEQVAEGFVFPQTSNSGNISKINNHGAKPLPDGHLKHKNTFSPAVQLIDQVKNLFIIG